MTPKEKAIDLMNKYHERKNSCLICVDEIIFAFNFPKYNGDPETEINGDEVYWLEVKNEITEL
jgi:hypothetical protein